MFSRNLFLQIIIGISGLWFANEYISGVEIINSWHTLFWAGLILGIINAFIKPILKLLFLPLRILTLGLFSLVINITILWVVDIFFVDLIISGITPLFYTTIIIWILSIIIPKLVRKKETNQII
ncbi:MAG: phage holin family protein [Patescibacteria group bacterium]|nr:phage holin family protein [Patescibacteria group bacterium]